MAVTAWYDTRWGQLFYWGTVVATISGVLGSISLGTLAIPTHVYLFGFLGATVYVFTSLAKKFDADDRYLLEIFSKGIAALPLAAGVYLLAFAFPGTDTSTMNSTRVIAGIVFLAGIYVSLTLNALGSLAERFLGISRMKPSETSTPETTESN